MNVACVSIYVITSSKCELTIETRVTNNRKCRVHDNQKIQGSG